MEKVNNFIDACMYFCYSHSFSLMDVMVLTLIVPWLVSTYSNWWLLLVVAWVPYSAYQARKWNET